MKKRIAAAVIKSLLLSLCVSTAASQQSSYTKNIEAWRTELETTLKSDNGWLTVAGLFFLKEGENSFGTNPLNDIVLSQGPQKAGVFNLSNGKITARATPGEMLLINGNLVSEAQFYPLEKPLELVIENLVLFVHMSGERLAIRLLDTDNTIRRNFTKRRWYQINETYRVRARFEPHDKPIKMSLQNILGDAETYWSRGSVTLLLNGKTLRMLSVDSNDQLWFIFRDLTSGSTTYPAGRFLYADKSKDDWILLDFNKAYNPPCAFNPYTTCPLPPKENRLQVKVEAGELNYYTTNKL